MSENTAQRIPRYTALCKCVGMLVIAEFSRSCPFMPGRCPLCKGTQFRRSAGWVECDTCWDFAIDEERYDEMVAYVD
jgi:hypothetical protein